MHSERLLAPSGPTVASSPSIALAPTGTAHRVDENPLPSITVAAPLQEFRQGDDAPDNLRGRSALRPPGLKFTMVFVDELAATLGMVLAAFLYVNLPERLFGFSMPNASLTNQYLLIPLALLVWPIAFAQQGLYHGRHLSRRAEEMRRLVNAVVAGTVAIFGLSALMSVDISRGLTLLMAPSVLTAVALEREVLRRVVRARRESGKMTRRVVLVGNNSEARELNEMLASRAELGYEVVGRVTDGNDNASDADGEAWPDGLSAPHLGSTDEILDVVRRTNSSGVIVATTDIDLEAANRLVRVLTGAGIYVELSSSMRDIAARRVTIRPLGRYPVMSVEPIDRTGWRALFKRGFDLIVATITLVLASPILLVSAIAIRVTSGPNVLFRQKRVGRHGDEFVVYKLRTMVNNAEAMLPDLIDQNEAAGPMFKMSRDPRVTRVGRYLRKTSIDELPQLLNVIKGDMSLVGPRPALPHEALQWNDELRERLRVQPGITGNWQVNGRFLTSLEDYQRLDLYYVDNWSIVTDLVIMAKTIPAVLFRNGAA